MRPLWWKIVDTPGAAISLTVMIELKDVTRRFGTAVALDRISLTIDEGSFTSLLGPSGCGKSTTLRIIAGLDQPTAGDVVFAGRSVTGLSAAERNIAMVFQSYALYPHMTVRQNITLPLAMREMNRWERTILLDRLLPSARRKAATAAEKVRTVAAMLHIEALLDRKPGALSGGQKQRAAVARALVRDPVAFLLDEPLSNLDAALRVQMRGELTDLHRRTGRTFIYVTHDQAEAMSMSDRIAVIMHGRIVQVGRPPEIYERPATREVAAFIGDHPINFLEVPAASGPLPPPFDAFRLDGAEAGRRIVVGLRPEGLRPAADGPLAGRIERLEYLGSQAVANVALAGGRTVRAVLPTESGVAGIGEAIRLGFDPGRVHLFDADSGNRLAAALAPLADGPTRLPLRAPR